MVKIIDGYEGKALERYKEITSGKNSIVFYRLYFNHRLDLIWYSYSDGNKRDGFEETLCVLKFDVTDEELCLNEYVLTKTGNLKLVETVWSKDLDNIDNVKEFKFKTYNELLKYDGETKFNEIVEDLYNSVA